MNELDLVRTVLDEVPEPAPAQLAAGRARLLAATTTAGSGGPRRKHRPARLRPTQRRLLLPASLTAVAAAALAVILAVTLTGGPATRHPAGTGITQSASLVASRVRRASAWRRTAPSSSMRSRRWRYSSAM